MNKIIVATIIVIIAVIIVVTLFKRKENYVPRLFLTETNLNYFDIISNLSKTSFEQLPDIAFVLEVVNFAKEIAINALRDSVIKIDMPKPDAFCGSGDLHLEGNLNRIDTDICLIENDIDATLFRGGYNIRLKYIANALNATDINISHYQLTGRQDMYSTNKGTLWCLFSFKTGMSVGIVAHAWGEHRMPGPIPNIPLGSIDENISIGINLQCYSLISIDIEKNTETGNTIVSNVQYQPITKGSINYSISSGAISAYDSLASFINKFGASIPSIEEIMMPLILTVGDKITDIIYGQLLSMLAQQFIALESIYWDIFGQWLISCTLKPNSRSLETKCKTPNNRHGPNIWNYYDDDFVYYGLYDIGFIDIQGRGSLCRDFDTPDNDPADWIPCFTFCDKSNSWFTLDPNRRYWSRSPSSEGINKFMEFNMNCVSFWKVPREHTEQNICNNLNSQITKISYTLVKYGNQFLTEADGQAGIQGPFIYILRLGELPLIYEYDASQDKGKISFSEVFYFKDGNNGLITITNDRSNSDDFRIIFNSNGSKDIFSLKMQKYLIQNTQTLPDPITNPFLYGIGYSDVPTGLWDFSN